MIQHSKYSKHLQNHVNSSSINQTYYCNRSTNPVFFIIGVYACPNVGFEEHQMKKYFNTPAIFITCLFTLSGCDNDETFSINPTTSSNSSQNNGAEKTHDEGDENINSCPETCAPDESCINNQCIPNCTDGKSWCGEECIDLAMLHMDSCSSCTGTYFNCDGNWDNGCEIDVADDALNCGSCDQTCSANQVCQAGECLTQCMDDEVKCGDVCLNKDKLHIASCTACAENYCDQDGNILNGCEINALSDDVDNCGKCGLKCSSGEICSAGTCIPDCADDSILCGNICVKPSDVHIKTCTACADGFADCDNDMTNFCETQLNTVQNCGGCNVKCTSDQECKAGVCTDLYKSETRMIVNMQGNDHFDQTFPVRSQPNQSAAVVGNVQIFGYVKTIGENDAWYHVEFDGKKGYVPKTNAMYVCTDCVGFKAIQFAEKYLYSKTQTCTQDFLTKGPALPYMVDLHDYNNHCADFVTAVLQNVGLISKHFTQVQKLIDYCLTGADGYREIPRNQIKAGDIWARRVPENGGTYSHSELIVGFYGTDHVVTLGSTNFASCAPNAARGGGYQRVIYTDRTESAQPGARYFTKQ